MTLMTFHPGAAEMALEFLDDLAVAAHRAVEALQIAVDDEDEIVEFLAPGERDCAQRLGLIGLAVAQKGPHLVVGPGVEAPVFQVLVESGLVDGHDRPEPHGYGRELPEVGHQPGVGIGGEPAVGSVAQFAPEIEELFFGQPSFEKSPRIDSRRGVALEIDLVAVVVLALSVEKVIESHFIEGRRGGKGRDMPADTVLFHVGANDHRHRVPSHQALDAALDLTAAGVGGLVGDGNGVDGRCRGVDRDLHPGLVGVDFEIFQELADPVGPALLEHPVQGLEPFPCLDRSFVLGSGVFDFLFAH